MQDLQSIVLGVIAGLLTNYIQKLLDKPESEQKSVDTLTAQFYVCLGCTTILLLIIPNLVGQGWYIILIRFIALVIAGISFSFCVMAFRDMRGKVPEKADCHTNTKRKAVPKKRNKHKHR